MFIFTSHNMLIFTSHNMLIFTSSHIPAYTRCDSSIIYTSIQNIPSPNPAATHNTPVSVLQLPEGGLSFE